MWFEFILIQCTFHLNIINLKRLMIWSPGSNINNIRVITAVSVSYRLFIDSDERCKTVKQLWSSTLNITPDEIFSRQYVIGWIRVEGSMYNKRDRRQVKWYFKGFRNENKVLVETCWLQIMTYPLNKVASEKRIC